MKRIFSLLLALMLCLSLVPAARADVLYEPDDTFYWDHRGECVYENRSYFAQGPDNVAVVYQSPKSAAVVKRIPNGQELWISYCYEDENGWLWGCTENYEEDWMGWVPMDYLLLKYDHICFQEEYADRIEERTGTVPAAEGMLRFWSYPGSDSAVEWDSEYLPDYDQVFTDDAGREWGYVIYHMGLRNVWVCLDDPVADYQTLYAEDGPQHVTHPVKGDSADLPQIKPGGPSLGGILIAVCVIAILSGGFLWMTRKKQ